MADLRDGIVVYPLVGEGGIISKEKNTLAYRGYGGSYVPPTYEGGSIFSGYIVSVPPFLWAQVASWFGIRIAQDYLAPP